MFYHVNKSLLRRILNTFEIHYVFQSMCCGEKYYFLAHVQILQFRTFIVNYYTTAANEINMTPGVKNS
jgi:hypothetical protein